MNTFKPLPGLLAITAAALFSQGTALAAATSGNMPAASQDIAALQFEVPIANIANNDERGAAANVIKDFHIGSGALITSLRWDVSLTSHAGSYLSEMQLTFSDTLGNGVTFTPGSGDDFDGTVSYSGFQDLNLIGQAFQLGDDGILRLEFHDSYKDLAFDEPEGVWNSGTLTFGISPVPEPQTYALLLGGLLLLSTAVKRHKP